MNTPKNRYHRQAEMMRDYATKARESKQGKYRGITADRASKLADHHQAIGDGKIKPGTPCAF